MVILAALFGMLCWGIAPIFGKLGLAGTNSLVALAIRTYISTGLITVWIVGSGVGSRIGQVPPKNMLLLGIEGLFAALIGDLAYYFALKYGKVSTVTIIMSCSPVVSLLAAILFLHEDMSILKLLGSLMIVIGLIIVVK